MQSPQHLLSRQRKRSKALWCCLIAVILAILILIIVPTAVVLSRKNRKYPDGLPAKVLLPLYEFPEDSAWDPLYSAIESNSNLDFIVIINPDSGPGGMSTAPGAEFSPGIQKLNNYSNVQTVGYVRTGYGTRPVMEIVQDIETYAQWADVHSSLAMHGIFFDEAAYEYSPENVEHLYIINQFAKNSTGIREPRTVIHNPGILPDARLNTNNTDITVTFEQSLKEFHKMDASLQESPFNRTSSAFIVHSAGPADLKQFVPELSYHAGYLFVTSNKKNYYSSFGKNWQKFVDAVPTNASAATR
ncbi:Spherulin-4 [Cercospora beticola]|uniref:Spherulin-4 n=1 Tax=Cercospora beticola TaxID=122368 RepID=A0A2G5HAD7_CERBT|nr:Spherulin-4 [Cercospora beticola]PIA89516.1 Spherulin-4 [Cercospora beticola]WPB03487.1 hypothetical protein RHO25_008126 [Cercospora beticola]